MTDPIPAAEWVTISVHPPSPNCHFAGFITPDGTIEARAVDFMALQQHMPVDADEDDDEPPAPLDSRIVPIVIDWTGRNVLCLVDGPDRFAGLASSAKGAEDRAKYVKKLLDEQAPAEPAAAP